MTLDERLAAGQVVILDGATGTELERRGVPAERIHTESFGPAG